MWILHKFSWASPIGYKKCCFAYCSNCCQTSCQAATNHGPISLMTLDGMPVMKTWVEASRLSTGWARTLTSFFLLLFGPLEDGTTQHKCLFALLTTSLHIHRSFVIVFRSMQLIADFWQLLFTSTGPLSLYSVPCSSLQTFDNFSSHPPVLCHCIPFHAAHCRLLTTSVSHIFIPASTPRSTNCNI